MLRRNSPSRNRTVTGRARVGRMLGAPLSRSADGRRVTDGGFRPDGTFVSWPVHDTAPMTEAFRRAVLRLFVRLGLFDEDQAAGRLTWPHSGFHVLRPSGRAPSGARGRPRLCDPARSVLCSESGCARTVDVRPERESGDLPLRQVPTCPKARRRGPRPPTCSSSWPGCWSASRTNVPDKGPVTTRDDGWYAHRGDDDPSGAGRPTRGQGRRATDRRQSHRAGTWEAGKA